MKLFFFFALNFLNACSSYEVHRESEFNIDQTCSEKSIAVINASKPPKISVTEEDLQSSSEYLNKIQYLIQACYKEDITRQKKAQNHRLCLVAEIGPKSEKIFFEISSNDKSISPLFWECLLQIESAVPSKDVKNLLLKQSFFLGTK